MANFCRPSDIHAYYSNYVISLYAVINIIIIIICYYHYHYMLLSISLLSLYAIINIIIIVICYYQYHYYHYHEQKKTRQLSLASALSQLDQPTNTGKSSNKYYRGTGSSLTRPSLNRQQQSHHVSKEATMLTSVHLDCSKVNVGTLTGIAEGATVSCVHVRSCCYH